MTTQQYEELLEKVKGLQEENKRLKKRKKYGLVWEDKPEIFDEQSKNALPVLVEKDGHFNDTVSDPDGDFNILIEGDNYHSLSVLKYTHRNSIDVIYIDPPYNTGNKDFIYNDHIIDKDDTFRHSKWLSFINKRLRLSKDLMRKEGVIFISIDDNEQAQLKMLCDNIFGNENFIACLPTIMNLKGNQDQFGFAGTHEYTLVYAKDKKYLTINHFNLNDDELSEWEIDDYGYFKKGSIKGGGANGSREKRPNLFYPIFIKDDNTFYVTTDNKPLNKKDISIFPISDGKEMTWRWSKEKLKNEPQNVIVSRTEDKIILFRKVRASMDDTPSKKPKSIFYKPEYSSGNGTNLLKNIFNERRFNNPKPINLIKDIVFIGSRKNSTVLDFMAGSGTTGHAVLELNKEDGGNRKFILCTNNENKICEEVTYERIKRVSQGYKNKKGEKVEGLGGNLKYLKTDFIKIDHSIDDLKEKIVEASTQIICLKESTFKENNIQEKIKIYESSNQYTAILFDTFYLKEFTKVLNTLTDKKVAVYVFAYDKNFSKEEFQNLSQAVEYTVEPIPEKLLETYQEIFNF